MTSAFLEKQSCQHTSGSTICLFFLSQISSRSCPSEIICGIPKGKNFATHSPFDFPVSPASRTGLGFSVDRVRLGNPGEATGSRGDGGGSPSWHDAKIIKLNRNITRRIIVDEGSLDKLKLFTIIIVNLSDKSLFARHVA